MQRNVSEILDKSDPLGLCVLHNNDRLLCLEHVNWVFDASLHHDSELWLHCGNRDDLHGVKIYPLGPRLESHLLFVSELREDKVDLDGLAEHDALQVLWSLDPLSVAELGEHW